MTWVHTVLAVLLSAVGCFCYEANGYSITTTDSSAIPRTEALECGNRYSSMNATGYRVSNNGDICEELPFSWLSNQIYETGYVYFVRSRSVKVFTPPLVLSNTNSVHYSSLLPCTIEIGSVLELRYSLNHIEYGGYTALMGESGDVKLISTIYNNLTTIILEAVVGGVIVEVLELDYGIPLEANVEVIFSMHIASLTQLVFKVNYVTFHVFTFQAPLPLASLRELKFGAIQDSLVNLYRVAIYSDV